MSLRQLLTYAHESDAVMALAESARVEPQRAFVSASLRPYLLAALLDSSPHRPALVVAGDDRAARDLAADLKTFLSPRPVRFYPARGVRYESHLAPPPHLVGLRVAALEALATEIGPEHRELAEMAALEEEGQRPDVADVLPVDRFCDVVSLLPSDSIVAIAAEEEIEPSLADYWEEVTTSFHDQDAHHLYISP